MARDRETASVSASGAALARKGEEPSISCSSLHFPLTQEFLAQMLGVRRPSVSLVRATFQRAGLIKYSRGRITILDRSGIEEASCECYAFVQDQFDQALDGRKRR